MFKAVIVRTLIAVAGLRERLRRMRDEPDAGYTTEQVVVTALLAAAAIVVVGIIVAKVTSRANGINLGP